MSKLPPEHKFVDLSDYGRAPARVIANAFKNTAITPIHVTMMFVVAGIIAIACILTQQFWLAAFFLILKSILDAADGELARVKNTPSYVGRYFDSVSDFILNFFFLCSICYITQGSFFWAVIAFMAIQLQGTLYNYYYVILRNKFDGDTTSRVFEVQAPTAMAGESQRSVDIWFSLYTICYGVFDRIIYFVDRPAENAHCFPKWFMTLVSSFGLGFQLLIISVMLCIGWAAYVIPFFVAYTIMIAVFIVLRKYLNRHQNLSQNGNSV